MKKKVEEHECFDYLDTKWRWNTKLDDWEPIIDVCTKCGEIIHEY